jgi:prepilin-type N-terminal cleavage/methylation domain-containing protein
MRNMKARGFSLVEMMISIAVLAIIALAIYALIVVGSNSYANTTRKDTLQSSARNALEQLSDEIRFAVPDSTFITLPLAYAKGTQSTGSSLTPTVTPTLLTDGSTFLSFRKVMDYTEAVVDPLLGTETTSGAATYGTTVEYLLEPSMADANNNGVVDECKLVRRYLHENGATIVESTICDHVVYPGGFTATYSDKALIITLKLSMVDGTYHDGKPKTITTTATTTLHPRNKKI